MLFRSRGGVGIIIITLEGETLKYGVQLKFPTTNNEAEYKGILTGLRVGKALGAKKLASLECFKTSSGADKKGI